ncbi:MAG: hypothetical protein V3V16_06335 [Melioribacteraceae bacterium]
MKNRVKEIIEKVVAEQNLLLVDVVIRGKNISPKFEVFIDNVEGIHSKICSTVSRAIKEEINETEFAEYDYMLVVSSPGIDKPLLYLEQYAKHINRTLAISFLTEQENILSIEAQLKAVNENELTFIFKKEDKKINFNNIKKAKVKISF